MSHKGDVFEAALLNVGNDSPDAVLVPDSVPYCLWPVPREGGSMRHLPFSGKMARDALPCPSARAPWAPSPAQASNEELAARGFKRDDQKLPFSVLKDSAPRMYMHCKELT